MKLTELKTYHIVDLDRLDKDSIIVDAGACIGEATEELREYFQCKIYAIEPDEENLRVLGQKNFDNITIINKALVGIKRKTMLFYKVGGRPEWGNVMGNHATGNIYSVETITLDELPKIDYLKMDIEGMEWEVIENLKQKIPQMSIETHGDGEKIIKELKRRGYKVKKYLHNEIYVSI